MDWRGVRERLRRVNPLVTDVALTTAVLVITLAWIAAQSPLTGGGRAGFDAFAVALVASASVPLLWRRRAPVAVLLVVAVATGTYAFMDYRAELVVPLAVAAFSASARLERKPLIAATAVITLAASFAITLNAPEAIASWVEGLFGVGTGTGLPILLGRIVANRRKWIERDLAEAARDAVAAERSRMARELHDVVAHAMGVMVVQAGAGRRVLDHDPAAAVGAFGRIEDTGRTGLAEMRRLLGVLRTDGEAPALLPQPGLERLDELLETVRGAGLPIEAVVEGSPRPLPPGVDLTAYRVVQEALTNTLRHAGSAQARVLLRYGDEALELEVADDGRGPPVEGWQEGRGLIGMQERVSLFRGSLETEGRVGGGFVVRARIPLNEAP